MCARRMKSLARCAHCAVRRAAALPSRTSPSPATTPIPRRLRAPPPMSRRSRTGAPDLFEEDWRLSRRETGSESSSPSPVAAAPARNAATSPPENCPPRTAAFPMPPRTLSRRVSTGPSAESLPRRRAARAPSRKMFRAPFPFASAGWSPGRCERSRDPSPSLRARG